MAREHEMREVLRENKRIGELRTALNYELHASLDVVQSAAANFRAEMEAWGLGFDQFSRGGTIDTSKTATSGPSSAARSKVIQKMRKKCSARPTAPWRPWLKPPPTSANCWRNCAASRPNALFQEPPPRRRFWLAGRSFPIIVMRILKVRFKALLTKKSPSERILTSTHIFSG